ncbi:MAG: hypothetical protein Q8J78_11305, partial [Moraxellaceae bacterium]|nr:hypothetical protein [Moraxellaceae bacterium]
GRSFVGAASAAQPLIFQRAAAHDASFGVAVAAMQLFAGYGCADEAAPTGRGRSFVGAASAAHSLCNQRDAV